MMKYLPIGLLLLCSCSDQKVLETYYEDGKVYEAIQVSKDSIRQGMYVKFANNGDTLEKSFYHTGVLNGRRVLYFDDNKIEIIENYVNDSLYGLYQVFYEQGGISMETRYEDNVINGMVRRYYPSGQILEEVSYVGNEENGPFTEYHENGTKKWEGIYRNGDNEVGLLLEFAENGDTIKKMMCDDRYICTTIWRNPEYQSEQ